MNGFGQIAITQHSARHAGGCCCGTTDCCKGVVSVFKTVNCKTVTTPCVQTVCGSVTKPKACGSVKGKVVPCKQRQ